MSKKLQAEWKKLNSVLTDKKPLLYIENNVCHIGIGSDREQIEISEDLLKFILKLSIVMTTDECPMHDEGKTYRFVFLKKGNKHICLNAHTLLRYTMHNKVGIFILLTHHFPELYDTKIISTEDVNMTKMGAHLAPFGFYTEKRNHIINPYYHNIKKGERCVTYKLNDTDMPLREHKDGDKNDIMGILDTYKVLGELQTKCPERMIYAIKNKVDNLLTFWSMLQDILLSMPYSNDTHSKLLKLIPGLRTRDYKHNDKPEKEKNHNIGKDFAFKYLPLVYQYKEEHDVWPLQVYPPNIKIDISPDILKVEQEICPKLLTINPEPNE